MRAILHALVAAALAVAPACTLESDGGPDHDNQGPWSGVDAGPWSGTPDAANPCDPWPVGDAGSWVPTPDAADPWPPYDAGPWVPTPDAAPWVPPPDAAPWPVGDAGHADPCSGIASEAVCIVTLGCDAHYQGIDCQCYADGTCTCDAWEFDHCE